MRIGVVRSDIPKIYLSDLENTSQRNFSSEAAGQSRYISKPTDAKLAAVLAIHGSVAVLATDTAASVNTSTNNTLRIRRGAADTYQVVVVTTGAAVTKVQLVADLNAAFATSGLAVSASISGTNQVLLTSTGTNKGVDSRLQIDSAANGSTLSTALGFNVAGVTLTGLSVAALKAAVYPTATTINVATATITALGSINSLAAAQKASLVLAVQDAVAPSFSATTRLNKSATSGVLSKLTSASFRPGKGVTGLPAGICVAMVQDDGSTVFTPS